MFFFSVRPRQKLLLQDASCFSTCRGGGNCYWLPPISRMKAPTFRSYNLERRDGETGGLNPNVVAARLISGQKKKKVCVKLLHPSAQKGRVWTLWRVSLRLFSSLFSFFFLPHDAKRVGGRQSAETRAWAACVKPLWINGSFFLSSHWPSFLISTCNNIQNASRQRLMPHLWPDSPLNHCAVPPFSRSTCDLTRFCADD